MTCRTITRRFPPSFAAGFDMSDSGAAASIVLQWLRVGKLVLMSALCVALLTTSASGSRSASVEPGGRFRFNSFAPGVLIGTKGMANVDP
jgi:hypothetical protein